MGGIQPASSTARTCTEAYNGASWTVITPMINVKRCPASTGTQNAALNFGGYSSVPTFNLVNAYNGISWESRASLNVGREGLAGSGVQNDTIAFGGGASTEKYNGVSWTVINSLNSGRGGIAGAGTQKAALAFSSGLTEAYNIDFQTFNYSPTTGNLSIGTTFSTSSLNVTGSINVSGSGVINNLTASYAATASFATTVIPITSKTLVIAGTPTIQAADVITYPMWRIPYPVTASLISVYSTGSLLTSGSQVNASKNSSLLLATPLTLTGSRWVSSSVLQNQNFVAGDILSFNFLSLTGSLTSVIVQVDFIK